MQERKRQIFRNESWQRYLARQEATIFPRLVTPRSLAVLWLILALIITADLLVLSIETPLFSSGVAVRVAGSESKHGETVFAVLLSGRDAPALRAGAVVKIEPARKHTSIVASIFQIENAQISMSEATTRFGLTTENLTNIRFPASVAFARSAADVADLFRSEDRSAGYRAQIQRGSQRALSYLLTVTNDVKAETR